jgi:hypothetical protein
MLATCVMIAAAVATPNAARPMAGSRSASVTKKMAGANRPSTSPSSTCVAPAEPCVRCVKMASTAPKTGNGDTLELLRCCFRLRLSHKSRAAAQAPNAAQNEPF